MCHHVNFTRSIIEAIPSNIAIIVPLGQKCDQAIYLL